MHYRFQTIMLTCKVTICVFVTVKAICVCMIIEYAVRIPSHGNYYRIYMTVQNFTQILAFLFQWISFRLAITVFTIYNTCIDFTNSMHKFPHYNLYDCTVL